MSMIQQRVLFTARLLVTCVACAFLGAGIVAWAGFGRLWLGIGALLAAFVAYVKKSMDEPGRED
jgi:hypothetical protein